LALLQLLLMEVASTDSNHHTLQDAHRKVDRVHSITQERLLARVSVKEHDECDDDSDEHDKEQEGHVLHEALIVKK